MQHRKRPSPNETSNTSERTRTPGSARLAMFRAIQNADPENKALLLQKLSDLHQEQKFDLEVTAPCTYTDPKVGSPISTYGTLLGLAAHKGLLDAVNVLLDWNAKIDGQPNQGPTPLMLAAEMGHTEVVSLLLEKKARIDYKSKCNETALSLASHYGHCDTMELLLSRKASVDCRDDDDMTPLLDVILNSSFDDCNVNKTVSVLLKYKADVNAKTESGLTPLEEMICADNDFAPADYALIAKNLLTHGAEVGTLEEGRNTAVSRVINEHRRNVIYSFYSPTGTSFFLPKALQDIVVDYVYPALPALENKEPQKPGNK